MLLWDLVRYRATTSLTYLFWLSNLQMFVSFYPWKLHRDGIFISSTCIMNFSMVMLKSNFTLINHLVDASLLDHIFYFT